MLPETIRRKLRDLPDHPGCYLFRDRRGRIIYVGKAVSLRHRVRSYFRRAARRGTDPKLRGLAHSIADIETLPARSETAALLLESRLIKAYRPWFNRQFKDDKRYPLLAVDIAQPFPRFRLCRVRRRDGQVYFGPYASSPAARAALEFVEKRFGTRRCAAPVPGPADHAHCINDLVRFCAAPCVGAVSPEAYRERVAEACAFLRGERPAVLADLRAAMLAAAEALEFEKAAALRDTLQWLRTALRTRPTGLRTPGAAGGGRAGLRALAVALGLPRPPRRVEAFDISTISGRHAVGSSVVAVDGVPRPALYRRYRVRSSDARDDTAMMAEVIRRRFARLVAENARPPELVLVDGGAGQVRAAERELKRLGLDGAPPVAGLAKRQELLLWRGRTLALDRDSPALQVLQRLRDEAHRFALAYHRRLRARCLRESLLDEVPGIGPERKRRLLRACGSLAGVVRAPEAVLAAVPGIGPRLARTLRLLLAPAAPTRLPRGLPAAGRSGTLAPGSAAAP